MEISTIILEGGVKASLDWTLAKIEAREQIEKNKRILWNLDLGLFNRLVHPFSQQSQFLSLRLSIDHFKREIWPVFGDGSAGVLLYNGPADYRRTFPWDAAQSSNLCEWLKEAFPSIDELNIETGLFFHDHNEATAHTLCTTTNGSRLLSLFCRDACVEYLNLLAANIPDEIPVYAKLETSEIDDLAFLAQLTTTEKYERLQILPRIDAQQSVKTAVCLPPSDLIRSEAIEGLNEAMQALENREIAYKIIPEASLITEWDELDNLIVCPKGVGPQGFRKFQGFCAANGRIVTLGSPLGLVNEIAFGDWLGDNTPIQHSM